MQSFVRPARLSVAIAIAAMSLWPIASMPALAQDAPAPEKVASPQAENPKIIVGAVDPYGFSPKDPDGEPVDFDFRKKLEEAGPTAIEWYQHVMTLSNPFFEGRAPGSRGAEIATEYMEFWIKKAGLEPAFPSEPGSQSWTSYRQKFQLPGGTAQVRSAKVTIDGRELARGKDYEVLGSSGAGSVTAPLAWAGYGIEQGRDDYKSFAEGADFNGRIVVLLRYEPLNADGKSRWSERRFSEHAAIAPKLANLVKRHAAGIILVNPPGAVDGRNGLETTSGSAFGPGLSIPLVQLSQEEASKLLKAADPAGRTLEEFRKAADEGSLKSFNLMEAAQVSMSAELKESENYAYNVGGVLRGKGNLANEWVIVGGHYDHVGYGMFGASPSNRGKLHPGADDNASGSSGMLVMAGQLAEWMHSDHADGAPENVRSILFMAFSAEESGLLGSKAWTKEPTLELNKVCAMVNLDMIGRLRNDDLNVGGTGSAEGMLDIITPSLVSSKLTIHADPSGRGPSDHASFYGAGVPVIFMFTGTHADYHKPGDKGYTVNPTGAAKVIALTEDLTKLFATRAEKLVFKSTDRVRTEGRNYARVRFGVQPGLVGEGEVGVKVEAVSEGTSASDAGIQIGDILLSWNGEGLEGAGGLMEHLRNQQPGDKVTVKLKRGTETKEVEVTLKASAPRNE